MKFQSEGTFKVKIVAADIVEAKFADAPAVDVMLTVETADGHSDEWRGEVSDRYGRGNYADKKQCDITIETLRKLGYQHGSDFSRIDTLVGVETEVFVVASESKGKVYHNIKGIGESTPTAVPVPKDQIAARLAAIFGRPVVGVPAGEAQAAPAPAPARAAFSGPKKINPYA